MARRAEGGRSGERRRGLSEDGGGGAVGEAAQREREIVGHVRDLFVFSAEGK